MFKYNPEKLPKTEAKTFVGNPTLVSCINATDIESNVQILDVIRTLSFFLTYVAEGYYDFWAPSLINNPFHDLMHKIPNDWYSILFEHMFRPSSMLKSEIEEFKSKYFLPHMIAIQIRTWTRNVAGADAERNPVIPLHVYLQAAEQAATSAPVAFKDVGFFIASPDANFVNQAVEIYGEDRVSAVKNQEISEYSKEGAKSGLLNFFLMGECNEIVASEISSYGTNAAARTGKIPIVCSHERMCYRRLTPDPCQDSPFPIRKATCADLLKGSPYVPGVQSTCAFFGYQRQHKTWNDFYNSWAWTGKQPSWKLGDVHGVVFD